MANEIIQFFAYAHLPEQLHPVSGKFYELATWIEVTLPDSAEKSTALRKLLEAKDCAVRARILKAKNDVA